MYLEGLGVAADTLQAAYWCALSADLGAEPAQYLLAGLYYTGMGIGVDYAKAAYYYSLLAEKGDCNSQYWLGFSLLKQGKCEESMHWFLRAAEQDYVEAQKYLAHGYSKGACGLGKDWNQALYWGERAAKLGDLQFLYNVGAYYLKSDKDSLRKQGEHYLLCAVDADDAMAQYRLGHYYVRKSDSLFRQGVEYLILAVQKGHVEARIEFGQLCAGGYGYPRKGWEESLQNLLPRAAKGDVNAIHSVAGHYCASLDFETARYWFSKLAYRSAKLERLLECLPQKKISHSSD